MKHKLSIILLAGGKGLRFGGTTPKQYLKLGDKPVVRHSFDKLAHLGEMIVVAAKEWHPLFPSEGVLFAEPGIRRQDSLYNGLQYASGDLILIHDGARPFFDLSDVEKLIETGEEVGAAALATPLKNTLKRSDENFRVKETLDRALLWEIHTPQVVKKDSLIRGCDKAIREGITVTDDVAVAELIGAQVKLVLAKEGNIKITTAEDLAWAEWKIDL